MNKNFVNKLIGNLACFSAYLLFGFNIICCKNISNCGMVSPIALFCMRSIGATILFWLASLFFARHEHIDWRDLWKIAIASLLGLFLTLFSFLKAITMCTAIDASIMTLLSPIMAMIISAIAIKEKITGYNVIGMVVSLVGVLFIIFNSVTISHGADATSIWGILLMIVNMLCFTSYVGIFKPLVQKYSVITFMKWMFLIATIYALPFGINSLREIQYSNIPFSITWQILFVVVGATFVAYFLVPIGQKRLKPVAVCMYSYVQPVIAMGISLVIGIDNFTWSKALAAVLVFIGVGIVNFSPKTAK